MIKNSLKEKNIEFTMKPIENIIVKVEKRQGDCSLS